MDKKLKSYFETIRFIEGLQNVPGQKDYMTDRVNPEMYLKRMRFFLDLVPDIRRTVLRRSGGRSSSFKFIHVAGTSGKGSVTAMLHETLRATGKRAGSFTSPFTTTSIEKIRVGDKYISPAEVVEIVRELKPYITRAYLESPYGGPSYFEIWFAIAIKYFLRKKCEWVVLEVGLGGKYDPGVLLSGCAATALTNVDFDHTHLLGRTLAEIGREKAGIMRRRVPFFTTEDRPELLEMFKRMGRKVGARVFTVPTPRHSADLARAGDEESHLHVRLPAYAEDPSLVLRMTDLTHLGMNYQGRNTALATAVAEYLNLPERAVIAGIKKARLPCRFEVMPDIRRTVLRRSGGRFLSTVILDGAHSVSKMRATATNLESVKFRKLHLVLAIAANKDVDGICKVIVPRADQVYVTRFDMPFRECAHPRELINVVKRHVRRGARAQAYMDSRDALESALQATHPQDLVLATGSFFLAGELRKRWYSEERILKTLRSF